MDNKIFLPNEEQVRQFIEDSWLSFRQAAAKAGFPFDDDPQAESFARDMFAAGYCYGHNDCLSVIRGQLEATDIQTSVFKAAKRRCKNSESSNNK